MKQKYSRPAKSESDLHEPQAVLDGSSLSPAATGVNATTVQPSVTVPGLGTTRVTPAQRAIVAEMLSREPRPSDTEIAAAARVSRIYVLKARQALQAAEAESTEEYGRALAKRLPMRARVAMWGKLVSGELEVQQAHAVRPALIRVEELIGHVTARERKEAEANHPPGPLFHVVVQPGASMAVMAAPVRPQQVAVGSGSPLLPEGRSGAKPDGATS